MYVTRSSNKNSYKRVFSMLKDHHKWFENSIPLIASENIPSPAVREAIVSDFGNRYAEGWPGERVYAGCVYIDKVEVECMSLAKKLFKAEFADVRPISGVIANLVIYSAFSNPEEMTIDVDKTKKKVEELKTVGRLPKMAMFGGSLFLFPHPVKELADFFKS